MSLNFQILYTYIHLDCDCLKETKYNRMLSFSLSPIPIPNVHTCFDSHFDSYGVTLIFCSYNCAGWYTLFCINNVLVANRNGKKFPVFSDDRILYFISKSYISEKINLKLLLQLSNVTHIFDRKREDGRS